MKANICGAMLATISMACLFLDSAAAGSLIPVGVPVFREHRTNADGSPAQARVFSEPFEVAKLD